MAKQAKDEQSDATKGDDAAKGNDAAKRNDAAKGKEAAKGKDAKKGNDAKKGKDAEKGQEGKKDKEGKKGKKGKKGASGGPSIATHPRAGAQVRRAKGWGGLGAFAIAGLLSFQAGVPPFDVGLRALVAGVTGYMLAWACSVTIWRHLVLAELRTLVEDGQLTPASSTQQAHGNQAPDEDGSWS